MDDSSAGGGHMMITFRVKGGHNHTVNLHPNLRPLFIQLRREKKIETYPQPKSPAKEWFNFSNALASRKRTARPHAFTAFASPRRQCLRGKGVSEKKAMSYLGHASTTIHRSYVRLRPDIIGLRRRVDLITGFPVRLARALLGASATLAVGPMVDSAAR